MSRKTFDQVRDDTLANLDQLVAEAEIVYEKLVLPAWGSPDRHGFPRTLYGYVMNAFSIIDLLSQYREPSEQRQAQRMRRLLIDYLKVADRPAAIAVQLWRHTLMHTSDPRAIRANLSGHIVHWLLHWREHLPRDQHMTVTAEGGPDEETFKTGGLYLLNDLRKGTVLLFTDLAATPESQAAVVAAHDAMLARQQVDV